MTRYGALTHRDKQMYLRKRAKTPSVRDSLIFDLRGKGHTYREIATLIPLSLCDPPISAVRCHQIYQRMLKERTLQATSAESAP